MMLSPHAAELLDALRKTLTGWDCSLDGNHVSFIRARGTHPYQPPRHAPSWPKLLRVLSDACGDRDISRGRPLPLRGPHGAELTFSAVQALDPYLKHRYEHVHGHGFIPQPVVRLTGPRDQYDTLQPGYSTSFVNISIVEPISSIVEHAALTDAWLGALSRLGLHTQHITITGSLEVWNRSPVSGITLRFFHDNRELGDAVLLWNDQDPSKLATDIGSGLERLAWIMTGRPWEELVYGPLAGQAHSRILDALRTATLVVGTGITPDSRGPGSVARRLLQSGAEEFPALGTSRIIRWAHHYWSQLTPLPVPWPEVCRIVDAEVSRS